MTAAYLHAMCTARRRLTIITLNIVYRTVRHAAAPSAQ